MTLSSIQSLPPPPDLLPPPLLLLLLLLHLSSVLKICWLCSRQTLTLFSHPSLLFTIVLPYNLCWSSTTNFRMYLVLTLQWLSQPHLTFPLDLSGQINVCDGMEDMYVSCGKTGSDVWMRASRDLHWAKTARSMYPPTHPNPPTQTQEIGFLVVGVKIIISP